MLFKFSVCLYTVATILYLKCNLVIFQLNNLELAVNLAKRGNLPGAEELVCRHLSFYLLMQFYLSLIVAIQTLRAMSRCKSNEFSSS